MAIEKYIIDKSELSALLRGDDLSIKPKGNIKGFCVEIAGTLTNGDVIKAMFPDAEVVEVKYFDGIVSHYQVDFGEVNGNQNIVNFKADLWNAPYQKGVEE